MIQMIPMSEFDFRSFRERSIHDYAQEKIRAGNWLPSEALQKTEAQFDQLLPQGLATKDYSILTIEDQTLGLKAGTIWFWVTPGSWIRSSE
jgi:hypothetical protein